MIEMTIDSIRVSIMNYQRVIILKEKNAERLLPIWIGPAEADSIAVKLQDVTVPRPLTHDLLASMIQSLGAHVESIIVSGLANDTFYAKVNVVNATGERVEVDSRPSDAIALAVRAHVPIFAEASVLDRAGVLLDKETGQPILPQEKEDDQAQEPKSVTEAELRSMSAFTDFIKELNLEDLGHKGGEGKKE